MAFTHPTVNQVFCYPDLGSNLGTTNRNPASPPTSKAAWPRNPLTETMYQV